MESEAFVPVAVPVSDYPARRVDFLSMGRLARGKLTMLDGDPGLGKSLLSLDFASRLSRGDALPGGEARPPMGVLLLSAEDDPGDTIRPRLETMGADLSRIWLFELHNTQGHRGMPSFPRWTEELRFLVDQYQIGLVVIDPLMSYFDAEISSNRDQEVRRALSPISQIAEETGAAIMFLRHLNKAIGGSALYRGGGSIGIIGAARFGMLVARDPDDPTRRIIATQKCNLAQEPESIAYRLVAVGDHPVVQYEGASHHTAATLLSGPQNEEERSAADEAKTWLADQLEYGSVTTKELQKRAREAGISWRTLERAKASLGGQSIKSAREDGAWSWHLPFGPKSATNTATRDGAWRSETDATTPDFENTANTANGGRPWYESNAEENS